MKYLRICAIFTAEAVVAANLAIAAMPSITGIKAFARPSGKVFAGQQFELCFDITMTQMADLALMRPAGLPEELRLGAPVRDSAGQDENGFTIRATMPAFSSVPLNIPSGRLQMTVDIIFRSQGFFGTSEQRMRRTVAADFGGLAIMPLPSEGRPVDFSGAVGRFALESQVEPRELAVGDIATWTLLLKGEGSLNGAVLSPEALPSALFKCYPAQDGGQRAGTLASDSWSIVPMSMQARQVPESSFAYFDPIAGRYERAVAPAIELNVSERRKNAEAKVKTIAFGASKTSSATNETMLVQLRLAPSEASLLTHLVPQEEETNPYVILEEAPGGWIRIQDRKTGHTGWLKR